MSGFPMFSEGLASLKWPPCEFPMLVIDVEQHDFVHHLCLPDTFKCISQNMASLHSSYETAHVRAEFTSSYQESCSIAPYCIICITLKDVL